MTKEELIQFLKDNLSIKVNSDGGCLSVSLYIGDDFICTDADWVNSGESCRW